MSVQALSFAFATKAPSPTAKAVLVALANRHNVDTGLCCPYVERLAEDTQFSERAVRDALTTLVKAGLVTRKRKHRDDGTKAGYVYRFPTLAPETLSTPAAGAAGSPAAGGAAQEPEEDLEPKDLSPAAPSKAERDAIWDALVVQFGNPTTDSHRRRFGKVQRELLSDRSLTPAQVAVQVPLRAARYKHTWPGVSFTLEAFAKHWPDLAGSPGESAGGGMPELPDGQTF